MAGEIIPMGFCQCGCGQSTELAKKTRKKHGLIKGQPLHFIHGHNGVKPNVAERLWSGMDKSGDCWVWTGKVTKAGYGVISVRGKEWSTHRLAYTLAKGPIPDRLDVLHSCDNPPCGRPDHLSVGTALENTKDMLQKGRGTKPPTFSGGDHPLRRRPGLACHGQAHPKAKLTEQQVLQIRKEHAAGISYSELAGRYEVDKSNIAAIVTRKTWRHLNQPP